MLRVVSLAKVTWLVSKPGLIPASLKLESKYYKQTNKQIHQSIYLSVPARGENAGACALGARRLPA